MKTLVGTIHIGHVFCNLLHCVNPTRLALPLRITHGKLVPSSSAAFGMRAFRFHEHVKLWYSSKM